MARFYDDVFFDLYTEAASEIDLDGRLVKLEKLARYFQEQAIALWMPQPPIYNCWWPWVKNYYGEMNAGAHSETPMIARVWIDQAMKKGMGY